MGYLLITIDEFIDTIVPGTPRNVQVDLIAGRQSILTF